MKKIIGITIICLIILTFTNVVQADSFSFIVTPDKTRLKPGDEIELTIKVADINLGENGINAIETKLVYDTNLFENVRTKDISSLNNWSIVYNSENTENKGKMLGMILTSGEKEDQEIAKIKLKVKEDVKSTTKIKKSTISFINIGSSNGKDIIKETDKIIPIEVEVDHVSQENTPEAYNNVNNVEVSNEKNSINNTANSNVENETTNLVKNGDSTTASGNVPQTGTNEMILIFLSAIVLIAGIASYTKYKRIKLK